jgi:hypothetical protein
MRENEKLEYDHLPILVSIIENFIFNPKNLPGTLETHRELSDHLMDEFNAFCLRYNAWQLSKPTCAPISMNHLRGLNNPEEHLSYLSTHKNIFSTWSALQILHTYHRPLLLKMHSDTLLKILRNLVRKIEENSTIKRYFPKPKMIDPVAEKKFEFYLTTNKQTYLSIGSHFLLCPLFRELIASDNHEYTTAAIEIGGKIYTSVQNAVFNPAHTP